MKPIVVPRVPIAGSILVALSVPIHSLASYQAATARGYPPIDPIWYVTPYLACCLVFFLPFFDDTVAVRRPVRLAYACIATFTIAAAGVGMPAVVPHQFNLAATFLLSVILGIVAVPAFIYAEEAANWFWGKVRSFSDTEQTTSGFTRSFRFSLPALLAIVTVVAVACGAIRMYATRPASPAEVHYQSRQNIHNISAALEAYRNKHGVYPYSDAGPEGALYALSEIVDASVFDAAPRKAIPAFWDHESQTLRNGDFLYLNDASASPQRILVVTRNLSVSGNALYAGGWGVHGTWQLSGSAAKSLLGSWASGTWRDCD